MQDIFERTELLLGSRGMERLKKARVAVFGVGGVGGYVVEALARSGVGALDLIDGDDVAASNLNRQIIATRDTVGRPKVEAARDRVLSINGECQVRIYRSFYLPETADSFDLTQYDYVVDAIDMVTAKLMLAERAKAAGTPLISSMGAGNKLDPTAFRVADIYQTKVCPLARVMRRELKKRGIESLKVVYSEELPVNPGEALESPGAMAREESRKGEAASDGAGGIAASAEGFGGEQRMRGTPGSVAFVPAVAGLIIAGEVIKDLL